MQVFSTIPNRVEPRGFVVGLEAAQLGNSLSCLANLVAFSIRTSVPVYYSYIDRYAQLFAEPDRCRALFDPAGQSSLQAMQDLQRSLDPLFERGFEEYNRNVRTIQFWQLQAFRQSSNIVLMMEYIGGPLRDWRDEGMELLVAQYCLAGNGLVFPGCFWNQYTDMRVAAAYGPTLRTHLGAIRPDGCLPRRQHRLLNGGTTVAIHMRQQTDFKTWHGGAYCYSISDYLAVIRHIHDSFRGRDHSFYICSDMDLDPDVFEELPVYYAKSGPLDDFCCMASCHYVVGPPGTFGTWSAFIGSAKRLVLDRNRIDRLPMTDSLLALAVDVPFPTGSYLPGDDMCRPI